FLAKPESSSSFITPLSRPAARVRHRIAKSFALRIGPIDLRFRRYFHEFDAVAVRIGDKRDALLGTANKFAIGLYAHLCQMLQRLLKIVEHETEMNVTDRIRRRR